MISPFVWVDIIRFQHSLFAFVFAFFVFFRGLTFRVCFRVFRVFRDPPPLTEGESGVNLRLGRVAAAVAVAVVLFAQCSQLGGRLTGMEML